MLLYYRHHVVPSTLTIIKNKFEPDMELWAHKKTHLSDFKINSKIRKYVRIREFLH